MYGREPELMLCGFLAFSFSYAFFFFQPTFYDTRFGAMLSIFGSVLVVVSVLGRCWAILHIGSRKNVQLVQTGPYGYCRNPLYFFSFLTTLGCGLISKSIVLSIVFSLVVLYMLLKSIRKEEQYLLKKFADEYNAYRVHVPKFLPRVRTSMKLSSSRTERGCRRLSRQFVETLCMLLLIPIIFLFEKIREFLQLSILVLI